MGSKIFALQTAGKSDSEILDQFVAENGKQILAITPGIFGTAGPFVALSLGAMGLETSFRKVRDAGLRPMLLGSGAWLFISAFSFALIRCLAW